MGHHIGNFRAEVTKGSGHFLFLIITTFLLIIRSKLVYIYI